MENLRTALLLIGSFSILFGYFRFITDEKGNVSLNNYRLTGGLNLVVRGMVEGTIDLFALYISKAGLSALAIYLGVIAFYLGFNLPS